MPTITKEVEIELSSIDLSPEELAELATEDKDVDDTVEIVKAIDREVGDWEFTKSCALYFMRDLLADGEDYLQEVLDALKLARTDQDNDEDEDEEDEEKEEEPVGESHFHVYRDGRCYCGEPAP